MSPDFPAGLVFMLSICFLLLRYRFDFPHQLEADLPIMDPVSLAASIITLISAASTTGDFLKKVWSLRNHPGYLSAALNDITDFKAMLCLMLKTVESVEDSIDDDVRFGIESLIRRAESRLSDFRQFINNLFEDEPSTHSKTLRLRRRAKLNEVFGDNQRKVDGFREELTSIKSELGVLLQITNA